MAYITKTNLFYGPRFGSQMAQYAGIYAVAKALDMEFVFIKDTMYPEHQNKLFKAFDLPNKIIEGNDTYFSRFLLRDVVVDERVFNLNPNENWDIDGWFHIYKYFHKYEADIKKLFTFKKRIREEAENKISLIKNGESYPLVSLHIRRGDYLNSKVHLNLSLSYYKEALSLFYNKFENNYFKLLVFSDDIAWCKQTIVGENVSYMENNSKYIDMAMMSLCDHNIIANSSFSWWGAYLNPSESKTVVCPYNFINPQDTYFNFINGNYFVDTWHPIKVN